MLKLQEKILVVFVAEKARKGEMPGPTLFLGTKDGSFILKSDLFVD